MIIVHVVVARNINTVVEKIKKSCGAILYSHKSKHPVCHPICNSGCVHVFYAHSQGGVVQRLPQIANDFGWSILLYDGILRAPFFQAAEFG